MATKAWQQRQRDEMRKRLESAMNAHPAEAQRWVEWNARMQEFHAENQKRKRRQK